MANTKRGEVSAVLDDCEWTLCLTLEGLAELEQAFRLNPNDPSILLHYGGNISVGFQHVVSRSHSLE